jgi:hypothetical protein
MAKTEGALKKRKGEAMAQAAAEEAEAAASEEAADGLLNPFRDSSFYITPTAPLRNSDEGWGLERASDKKKMRVEDMSARLAALDATLVLLWAQRRARTRR